MHVLALVTHTTRTYNTHKQARTRAHRHTYTHAAHIRTRTHNTQYTEQSLANLDPVVAKIKYKVRALDEDVLDAIRLQASSGDQGQRDLDDGKNAVKVSGGVVVSGLQHTTGAYRRIGRERERGEVGRYATQTQSTHSLTHTISHPHTYKHSTQHTSVHIQDLFAKIAEIKRKAEDSERMVKEICQDITRLDHAKKNLMATITTLNHLKLLVDGVDQLQNMTDKRQYATVANLLEATNALSVNFDSDNIPTLVAINSVIKDTRVVLEKQIRDVRVGSGCYCYAWLTV